MVIFDLLGPISTIFTGSGIWIWNWQPSILIGLAAWTVGYILLVGPVRIASEVRSDIGNGPLHPIWNSGLELLLGPALSLRGGWEWQEPTHQNFLSSGVGLVFGTVGLDVGWRHGLSGAGDLMVIGVRVAVQ